MKIGLQKRPMYIKKNMSERPTNNPDILVGAEVRQMWQKRLISMKRDQPQSKETHINPKKKKTVTNDTRTVSIVCLLTQIAGGSALHMCKSYTTLHRCNTLQHAATRCNTLQHTATHCSTLQHIATHCNILQHTTKHCNTLQHTAAHCSTLQHTATHCETVQHTVTQCNTLQHTPSHCCNALQHVPAFDSPHPQWQPQEFYGDLLLQQTATHLTTATHCNALQHIPASDLPHPQWQPREWYGGWLPI